MFDLSKFYGRTQALLEYAKALMGSNSNTTSSTTSSSGTVAFDNIPREVKLFMLTFLDDKSLVTVKLLSTEWRQIGTVALEDRCKFEKLPQLLQLAEEAKGHEYRSEEHQTIAKTVFKIISAFSPEFLEKENVRTSLQATFQQLTNTMRLENYSDPLSDGLWNFSQNNPNTQILPLWPTCRIPRNLKIGILEFNRRFEENSLNIDEAFEHSVSKGFTTGNGASVFFPCISNSLLKEILNTYQQKFVLTDQCVHAFEQIPTKAACEKLRILGDWYKNNHANWTEAWVSPSQLMYILEIAASVLERPESKDYQDILSEEIVQSWKPTKYSTWSAFADDLKEASFDPDRAKKTIGKFWS